MKKVWCVFLFMVMVSCGGDSELENETTNPVGSGNSNNNNTNPPVDQSWLIPVDEVLDGGPGKDGIPSLDNTPYTTINDPLLDFMNDEDLVVGVVVSGRSRAYPHRILDWHEIVNNRVGGKDVTINYCPLTGTAFSWESKSNDVFSTFGVSGLLYNANLILYDRETDSYWSQMRLQCVSGPQQGEVPQLLSMVETTWGQWKALYPNSDVLSPDTGFPRAYEDYPYGDYRTNHDFLLFPAAPLSDLYPNKKRVFAILSDDIAKVYSFEDFTGGKTIRDSFNGVDYLLVGNEEFITAYEVPIGFRNRVFTYDFFPADKSSIFTDDFGNRYSLFGKIVEGDSLGVQLTQARSVTSYWFAISAFYPNPTIF